MNRVYYNPQKMGFGVLRVINDDTIKPNYGFDPHPHKDMEIITYVRKGSITHIDDKGNEGKTIAGDIQVMSAGTGIYHSEYNLENEETKIYQIWIKPNKLGAMPYWKTYKFPKEPIKDYIPLLVSGDKKAPLFINQDAEIYAGKIEKNSSIDHKIKKQAYILVSEGKLKINNNMIISQGDGASISNTDLINLRTANTTEVIIIDVPTQ